jgi:hypothetical protein
LLKREARRFVEKSASPLLTFKVTVLCHTVIGLIVMFHF